VVSFFQLLSHMSENQTSPLMNSGEVAQAVQVIRVGNHLHGDDQTSFWDEFIQLCSHREGMADLLGVDQAKVCGWPAKIKDLIDQANQHGQAEGDDEESEVMPTGDGPLTSQNMDPDLGV
jgi:hypothetical protein